MKGVIGRLPNLMLFYWLGGFRLIEQGSLTAVRVRGMSEPRTEWSIIVKFIRKGCCSLMTAVDGLMFSKLDHTDS